MATGGIFQLITNDGRQDLLLMATDFLNKRLARIKAERIAARAVDVEPTLADVTKTHILFTNAQFKPFAAIGYEYSKVNTNSGSAQYGSTVTFSIPQFGDLFHDMVVHVVLQQPTLAFDTVDVSNQPAMRWASYPGERFLKNVKFEVNGNPLDEYNNVAYNFYRQFQLPVNKVVGWKRLMGQETSHEATVDQPNWVGSGVAPGDNYRQTTQFSYGFQTPTGQKVESVELYIPLLFWFNKDVRLSIPSVSIPYGQRFIYLTLANEREMYGLYPRGTGTWAAPNGTLTAPSNPISKLELYINNLFVQPEIHKLYIKRVTFNLIRVHRQQDIVISESYGSILLQQLKWPTEALFVGAKMTDYVSQNAVLQAQNLDKWDSFSKVNEFSVGSVGWSQYQTFAATGTIAMAGATNAVTGVGSAFTTEVKVGDYLVRGDGVIVGPVVAIASATALTVVSDIVPVLAASTFSIRRLAPQTSTIRVNVGPLESINIKVHGIDIYKNFPAAFYNSYLPYHYGGLNLNTPEDVGAYMIPFCLFPGTYQPSGHINISRAREFYIEYTLKAGIFAGLTSASAILTILASAINFLLISDGSAVLRYTT